MCGDAGRKPGGGPEGPPHMGKRDCRMYRIASLLLLASAGFAADAIYINGNVITVDAAKPYAEAFAVTNGRFSAIGSNAEIRRLASASTKIVDLKGMTVTPGF